MNNSANKRQPRNDPGTGHYLSNAGQLKSKTATEMPPFSKKTQLSRPARLSPAQLATLRTGPRVNVLVGPADDQFVGIEGAYVKLLTHYSDYAKQQLVDQRHTALKILDGTKVHVVWIYKYMLAGQGDPDGGLDKFEDLNIPKLVILYSHCAVLEYQQLMDRILARLNGILYWTLPDVNSIKNIAIFAPSLTKMVAKSIARSMAQPLVFEYEGYMAYAEEDEEFRSVLEQEVQEILERRITIGEQYYKNGQRNRFVTWSNQYYQRKAQQSLASRKKDAPDPKPAPTAASTKLKQKKPRKSKKTKKESRPDLQADVSSPQSTVKPQATINADTSNPLVVASDTPAQGETSVRPKRKLRKPQCYAYGGKGHLERDCTKASTEKFTQDGVVQGPGLDPNTLRNKTQSESTSQKLVEAIKEVTKKSDRPPLICYACNDEGHIARNCPIPPAAYQKAQVQYTNGKVLGAVMNKPREFHGRNKNYRRARAERTCYNAIVVENNGEGLKTCTREVKEGEFTHAGLAV